MSVWERYPKKQREEYIQFLKVYGGMSNLFRQKQGDMIPYLDSKFQETILEILRTTYYPCLMMCV